MRAALLSALLLGLPGLPASPPPKVKPKAQAKPKALVPAPLVNGEMLRPLVDALRALEREKSAGTRVVRILHLGDSHTAADFWTGRIRHRLQERFGDAGPGLVLPGRPWRGYPREGMKFLTGKAWPAQSLRAPETDGWVGLPGAAVEGVEGERFTVRSTFSTFSVHVLTPPAPFSLDAAVAPPAEDETAPPPPLQPLKPAAEHPVGERLLRTFTPQDTPEGVPSRPAQLQELQFPLAPGVRLLGVDLRTGRGGVLYDELGLNGAQLLDLDRWDPSLRRALLAQAKPDLLVLAYGTNDEGMNAEAAAAYLGRVRTLLRALREEAQAPVLVIGPLDRLGRSRRARPILKAGAQQVIGDLKAACLAEGCAFWDARAAMGGYGSISRWRRAGLAKRDLVHLTGPGYEKLGDLFSDRLLALVDQKDAPPRTLPEPTKGKPAKKPVKRKTGKAKPKR